MKKPKYVVRKEGEEATPEPVEWWLEESPYGYINLMAGNSKTRQMVLQITNRGTVTLCSTHPDRAGILGIDYTLKSKIRIEN